MNTTTRAPSVPPVLTSDGRAWLRARLDRLHERLGRVEQDLGNERTEELIEERQQLTAQADELAELLRAAVAPGDLSDDPTIVELGDEVEVEFPNGEREAFLIVHPSEAPMDEHRISSHAPLAAAVLGHRPGDRVTVTSPGGVYGCWIVRRERSA